MRTGGNSAPSLLVSSQGWERDWNDAVPGSPSYFDSTIPDAPAVHPLVPPEMAPEELLAMYKHKARTPPLESGDLAALAAAAGNAAAVAVLSAVQDARQGASVRLLAFTSSHTGVKNRCLICWQTTRRLL